MGQGVHRHPGLSANHSGCLLGDGAPGGHAGHCHGHQGGGARPGRSLGLTAPSPPCAHVDCVLVAGPVLFLLQPSRCRGGVWVCVVGGTLESPCVCVCMGGSPRGTGARVLGVFQQCTLSPRTNVSGTGQSCMAAKNMATSVFATWLSTRPRATVCGNCRCGGQIR